jgi:hypothetical protein
MPPTDHEVRDELIAILGAARELPPDAHPQLADSFVAYLARRDRPRSDLPLRQPSNSLVLAGMIWGIALVSLVYVWGQMLVSGDPGIDPSAAGIGTIVIIALAAALARVVLYLGRHGWRLPHLHIALSHPEEEKRRLQRTSPLGPPAGQSVATCEPWMAQRLPTRPKPSASLGRHAQRRRLPGVPRARRPLR